MRIGRIRLSVVDDIHRLLTSLGMHWHRRLLILAFLTLTGALAELMVVGAIVPFLAIISDPEGSRSAASIHAFLARLPRPEGMSLLGVAASLFIILALIAAVVRLALSRITFNIVFKLGGEIGVAIYERIIHQPYSFHIARNSSDAVAAIHRVVDITHNMIMPLVQSASAATIVIFILVGLFVINPVVAASAIGCFAVIYLVPSALVRPHLLRNGQIISDMVIRRIKVVQEGVGGIRDVLLDHAQAVYIDKFSMADAAYHEHGRSNAFLGVAPRFIVESLGLVVIAGLALVMSGQPGGIYAALPILGALAIGAQRMMPLLQVIYQSWTQIVGARASYEAIMEIASFDLPPHENAGPALSFERSLELCDLNFAYQQGPSVLSNINLTIVRGTRVGFIGSTGSGKSTLIDIIMGLLSPTSGAMKIDGVALEDHSRNAWQRNIAHVSQDIFLTDASIAQNIAFGVALDAIDAQRLAKAAELAELSDFIATLPQGFDSEVGERGVRLSGGQRQRIGIARALYKQTPVLILDEATSALDQKTETAVMDNLHEYGRDLTILIIAHRLSTVEPCDVIYRLDQGRIVGSGTFDEVLGHPADVAPIAKLR